MGGSGEQENKSSNFVVDFNYFIFMYRNIKGIPLLASKRTLIPNIMTTATTLKRKAGLFFAFYHFHFLKQYCFGA